MMDLSLDDLIKLKKQNRSQDQLSGCQTSTNKIDKSKLDFKRLKELGARSGIVNKKITSNVTHQQQTAAKSNKLQVSNLLPGINDKDIWDLFQEIGPVMKASIVRNSTGHSTGVAEVVYRDAKYNSEAIKTYHLRTLDGQPMHVKRVTSDSTTSDPATSLLNRLGIREGSGIQKHTTPSGSGRSANKKRNRKKNQSNRAKSEVPSVEDLDAELEAYRQSRSGPV